LIGIFALFWALGRHGIWTVNFRQIGEHAHLLAEDTILGIPAATFITFFLFLGATGKSAQIPLYVWLPDAMAGPTPVSALIHAATMVTAGVYMIGRLNFLYSLAPVTLTLVALIGAATAFFAATIGLVQNDIKRILAYSTVSQLGYMFLGMGVAAYGAGIFHLVTHAFFKALLFLGAGSVIHAMGGKQDIRDMGGLRKYLPTTFRTFLIGWLAICGIFPFAGFFSKDEILWSVFTYSNPVFPVLPKLLWLVGLLGAGLTAFYMSRLVFMTFFGELRSEPAGPHGGHGKGVGTQGHGDAETHEQGDGGTREHGDGKITSTSPQREPHESPWTMTYPLIALAVLSVIGGWFGVPHFLDPVFKGPGEVAPITAEEHSLALEVFLMLVSMTVALGGIVVAATMYLVLPELPDLLSARFSRLYHLLLNKYYVDEIYQAVFVNGLLALTTASARFDLRFIDGIVNGSARITAAFSAFNGWLDLTFVDGIVNTLASGTIFSGSRLRRIQTGQVQSYLFAVLGGVVIIILIRTFI
jgi:NADH-quinone oxidoreductase subunit L